MNGLRAKNKKPFSVRTLTKEEWGKVKQCKDMECGLNGWFFENIFRIPNFGMKYECKKHDLSTRRGGMFLDGIDNAIGFGKVLEKDVRNINAKGLEKTADLPIINFILVMIAISIGVFILTLISIGYWIIATLGTIIVFGGGQDYKTLEEILDKANCK